MFVIHLFNESGLMHLTCFIVFNVVLLYAAWLDKNILFKSSLGNI